MYEAEVTPTAWFPAVRTGSGADVFTVRRAEVLNSRRARAEITWLPHRAEEAFGIHDVQAIHNDMPMPEAVGCLTENKPHRPFRLLYTGNWSKRKGIDLLRPIMDELGDVFELWDAKLRAKWEAR